MSPNVGNFVHDLVEMAKAMETLPQVQAELDAARSNIDSQQATVQRLELKLMERANELTELQSRIRSLEVERDDAQFHALEADDRTSRALDFIKATFGNAGSLIQALEPARPAEPVTETTAAAPWPTASNEDHSPMAEPEGLHTTQPSATPSSGQSEVPPSASSTSPIPDEASHGISSTDASPAPSPTLEVAPAHPTSVDAATDQSFSVPLQSPGPFAGKLYSEVVKSGNYPTRKEWEVGGGTIDNWYA